MTDDPKYIAIAQQLDHSIGNILNELESTSRELEKEQNIVKTAGAWIEKYWGSKYDLLPTWAREIIDESHKLVGKEPGALGLKE